MHSTRLRVVDRGHGSYVYCDDLPSECTGMVCCLGSSRALSRDGSEVDLPPLAFRMLTFLASAAGRDVGMAQLVEHIWPESPPASARANLRSYVSRIRGLFGPGAVVRGHERLRLEPAVVPSDVYLLRAALERVSEDRERLVALLDCLRLALTSSSHPADAATTSDIQWPDLAGRFVAECFKRMPEADRAILLPVLTTLRELDPMNEGLCTLHLRILEGLGDRSAALAVFAEHRLRLSTELGISPSAELQGLNQKLLSAEAEPPSAPGPRVFELPSAPDVLLGRSIEFGQATAMLAQARQAGRVLLIHGQPGVGKTAFAVSLGHQLADRFADGVVYVEMHGNSGGKYDRGSLLRVILRSLDVSLTEMPDDVDRLEATYRSLLHARSLLVILDDAPRGFDFSGLISASSRSALCITAREPNLYVPARRHLQLSLPSLDVAAEILLQTACLPLDERHTEIAMSIVHSCGGLPLASRIIGGQLATNSLLTLEDVQRRVRRPRTLLDSLEYGNLSVRRVIKASLDNLDDRSVLLLRLLVFAQLPWIDADMIEAVLDSEPDFSLADIEPLVAPRIVDIRSTDVASYRLRIHDLVREVVKESMSGKSWASYDLDSAMLRILDWFQKSALRQHAIFMGNSHFNVIDVRSDLDEVAPDSQQDASSPAFWIERYEDVIANLIEVAAQGRWAKEAWKLAVTCAVLFENAHLWTTWRRTHLAALAGARRVGDSLGEGAVLLELAELDLMPDSVHKAESWLDEAQPVFDKVQHRKGLDVIEEKRGRIRFVQGRFSDARRHLQVAAAHFSRPEDKASAALVMRYLGQCHAAEGDLETAETWYATALALAAESSARRVEGQIYCHMASLSITLGRLEHARECCAAAYAIFAEFSGSYDHAYVAWTEARLFAELGDSANAYADAVRAEELALKCGDGVLLRKIRSLLHELARVPTE